MPELLPRKEFCKNTFFGYTKEIEYDASGNPVYASLHTEIELQNKTLKNKIALVEVFLTKNGSDEVILSRKQKMQVNPNTIDTAYVNLTLETPLLWDVDTPNLYKLHARVTDLGVFKTHFVPSDFNTTDETSVLFGVKTVTADIRHGLRVNGKSVKLKGGCLHHEIKEYRWMSPSISFSMTKDLTRYCWALSLFMTQNTVRFLC